MCSSFSHLFLQQLTVDKPRFAVGKAAWGAGVDVAGGQDVHHVFVLSGLSGDILSGSFGRRGLPLGLDWKIFISIFLWIIQFWFIKRWDLLTYAFYILQAFLSDDWKLNTLDPVCFLDTRSDQVRDTGEAKVLPHFLFKRAKDSEDHNKGKAKTCKMVLK